MNKYIDIKSIPIWIYLVPISVIMFMTYGIHITSDMGLYMNLGLNLNIGKGYTNMDGTLMLMRGPMFPLMIALSYRILGATAWSAFWVVRLFCILNPIVVFILGEKLFNKWVGLVASILLLSSYSVNFWSYRHIDPVWPFFIVTEIIFLYKAFESQNYRFFVFSAISVGIGFLVKESSILFFPLPAMILFAIKDYRRKENIKGVLFFTIALVIIILPWMLYVYSITSNLRFSLFGAGLESINKTTGNFSFVYIVSSYVKGLVNYYNSGNHSIYKNFSLSFIFLISWAYILWKSFKKDKAALFLIITFFLASPYLAFCGNHNLRVGQMMLILYITYIATAEFCLKFSKNLSKFISDRFISVHRIERILTFTILSGLIIVQTFVSFHNDRGNLFFLKRNVIYQGHIKNKQESRIKGAWSEINEKCAIWIKENLPAGSRLIVSRPSEGKGIYFYSGGQYPMFTMPIIQSNMLSGVLPHKNDKIIFMSSFSKSHGPQNRIYVLTENDLFNSIKQNDIDYIIVNKKRNYLTLYFDLHKGFKRIKEFDGGTIKIYKVLKAEPMERFKPLVSDYLVSYLYELKHKHPEKLTWYYQNFFRPYFGWDWEKVENIISLKSRNKGNFRVVKNNLIYKSKSI